MNVFIQEMKEDSWKVISESFQAQGWRNKSKELYLAYFHEQQEGKRNVFLAFMDDQFAGYLTILWSSDYLYFKERSIPEITDLNVLKKFQKKGIASKLMDFAEQVVSKKSNIIGIGVGLYQDYGNAQRLYIKRGYIPDGKGVHQNGRFIQGGDTVRVDDDLILCLTKQL